MSMFDRIKLLVDIPRRYASHGRVSFRSRMRASVTKLPRGPSLVARLVEKTDEATSDNQRIDRAHFEPYVAYWRAVRRPLVEQRQVCTAIDERGQSISNARRLLYVSIAAQFCMINALWSTPLPFASPLAILLAVDKFTGFSYRLVSEFLASRGTSRRIFVRSVHRIPRCIRTARDCWRTEPRAQSREASVQSHWWTFYPKVRCVNLGHATFEFRNVFQLMLRVRAFLHPPPSATLGAPYESGPQVRIARRYPSARRTRDFSLTSVNNFLLDM